MTSDHTDIKHHVTTTTMYADAFKKAKEYISDNVTGSPDMDAFCAEAGMSRRTLQRSLSFYSTNWRALLNNQRMHYATRMMNANWTDETISAQLGYVSVHVFRKAFARVCGVSTDEFRRLAQSG